MVSIRRRFNLAFLLLVFLPGLAVSVILSRLYVSALFATLYRETREVADQVAQNIRAEVDGVSMLASALVHDIELRTLADRYSRTLDPGGRLLISKSLDDKLVSFFTYSNRIGAVILYMKRGGIYYYRNYPNIRNVGGIDRSVYADAKQDPGKVYLLDTLTGVVGNIGEKFMLSVAVCPAPEGYDTDLDAILVMFRVPYFDRLMSRSEGNAAGDAIIYGRDGRVLLSSIPEAERLPALMRQNDAPRQQDAMRRADAGSAEAETTSFHQVTLGGRHWLASSLRMESTGWTIVMLADRAAITGRITTYQWYLYPALAFLTVIFLVYAGIFLSRIANPIRSVIDNMRRVGSGDYTVRIPPGGRRFGRNGESPPGGRRFGRSGESPPGGRPSGRSPTGGIEELDVLTESFNRMTEEIRALTVEREQRERERMKAEVEALRFQIDPHFVANTLNSIRLMALAAKAQAIADMTQALMRVLADSYATAGPMTDLAHEIANVHSYVGIMKIRFGEHFDVEYRIEERTRELPVLRMILQPIVENSILHGISGSGKRGRITLSSWVEEAAGLRPAPVAEPGLIAAAGEQLVIEIADDGVGMDNERVQAVLSEDAGKGKQASGENGNGGLHRIGLANVRRRVLLNFGEPFGLTVESTPGTRTVVRFRLPVLRREDGARA